MPLSEGTRLGAYEITGTLGKGGMGEVYRGHDPKLERDVAIKVLPESFTSDANRVARFEQEAKTLAALNHPNIAHVYGLEQADGQSAIVMELVEGPTLADRIEQGPVPADEALGIAMQIADALEAAHGRGIIHRDLKPANIKLRPDGTIKVLDFGIAKAATPELSDGSASPIMTTPATQVGVILGTAAYMSPEQARGKPVDQRTDVWAFGCVLYEMLTGQLAFGGEDVAVTLARVIANDTDLDSLPATISPAVQRTIELCLRKDPQKRVADIRDVRLALAGEFDAGVTAAATADGTNAAGARRGPGWPGLAAAALVTAVATATVTFFYAGNEPEPPRGTRFAIDMPQGGTLGLDNQSRSLAISPDGRTIAFATVAGPNNYTWFLRPIDALTATPLRGAGAEFETPFFSPDGRWLGFDERVLWRLSTLGGTPTEIASLMGRVRGASWGENDEIVVGREGNGLWIVPANGGEPEQLTEAEPGSFHRWPDWLPGNRAAVFALQRAESSQIAVADRATGDVRILIPDGLSPTWLDSGHLVYGVTDGTLRAVRFDDETLSIIGDPVAIDGIGDQPIAVISATFGMQYALAAEGTLLYGTRPAGNSAGVVPHQPGWLSTDGQFTPLDMEPCFCIRPAISPDGTSVAMTIIESTGGETAQTTRNILVLSLQNNSVRRLTFDSGNDVAIWSPDSTRIAYRKLGQSIMIRRADGTGETETVWANPAFPGSWAPDDRLLIDRDGNGGRDIAAIEARPGADPVNLLATGESEGNAIVSPDGRWFAYQTGNSLFVRPYPEADGGQWRIGELGSFGSLWAWSSDSARLYFHNDTRLMVTEIESEPTFSFSTPRLAQDLLPYWQVGFPFGFAVEPGTDRILVGRPVTEEAGADSDESGPRRLVVIQDFDEIVKGLLPQ